MQYFITTLLLFVSLTTFAQQAFFETTFYFEDAIGNRDSVIIGHDPAIDESDLYSPEFGEELLTEPWDTVFEVRVSVNDSWFFDDAFMKRNISPCNEPTPDFNILNEYNCYGEQRAMEFAIYAKHLPITVTWDQSAFDTSYCRVRSSLANHGLTNFEPGWWYHIEDAVEASVCLGEQSSWTTDLTYGGEFSYYYDVVPMMNGSMDTVLGQFLTVGGMTDDLGIHINPGPCNGSIPTSVNEVQGQAMTMLYPNPTSEKIYFIDDLEHQYRILDVTGKLHTEGTSSEIDLSTFRNQFLIILFEKDGQWYSDRIVKIE